MADYKAMYFYLAGKMTVAIDALEATTGALAQITEKLKQSQSEAEEMFMNDEDTVLSLIDKKLTPKDNDEK